LCCWTGAFASLQVLHDWDRASGVSAAGDQAALRQGSANPFYEVFIPLGDLSAVVSLLILVELARKAFVGLGRRAWIVVSLAVLAVGAVVLWKWAHGRLGRR